MSSGDPTKLSIQWGSSGALNDEVKYRTSPKSWKSYLFWLMLIIALMVFLYLMNPLA